MSTISIQRLNPIGMTKFVPWADLGAERISYYLERARFLQEKGYIDSSLDYFKVAERIYVSEWKAKLENGKDSPDF